MLCSLCTMSDPKVGYNFLGKCGVKVSNICLGTANFGRNKQGTFDGPRTLSEETAHEILDAFASHGGNFIDTADQYSRGMSETVIGNWLTKQDRKRFVIGTKVRVHVDPTDVNYVGLSRRHIVEGLEASLGRLQTHYVDLFQSHCWDAATPLDETLRTFDDLIRCGKVRYYGASNVCGWQLQKISCMLEDMGLNSCVSLQQQYNLLSRQAEFEEFMVCQNEGIGVLPWSPLKGGILTGKYKRGDATLDPNATRLGFGQSRGIVHEAYPTWADYVENDVFWKLMDTIEEIASEHGKSVSQVALRWLLQKDVVSSVVVGATSVKQLEENLGAATGWALSQDEMELLNDVSVRHGLYPHPYIWKRQQDRLNPYIRAYDPVSGQNI